jgi:heme A synthase
VAAFLALVLGLAQALIGTARVLLPPRPPEVATTTSEALAFDAAGLAVLAGTLLDRPAVTTAGGALLLGVLVVWARAERRSVLRGPWRWVFRGMVSVLALSVPVGVALAWWS